MSTVSLLNLPSGDAARNAFTFDHAMAHRTVMQVMGPLSRFSIMPYFIDPTDYNARPATRWHQTHQQGHDDFNNGVPAYSTALTPRIPSSQILIDSNLQERGSRSWWTFANHMEHFVAADAIVPIPEAVFLPWWWTVPSRVDVFW